MTHAEMNELYEMYALGVLDRESAEEIDRHLSDGCEYCLAHVREAAAVVAGLSAIAEPIEPPAHLRERIAASAGRARPARWRPWSLALVAACAALLLFSIGTTLSVRHLQARLAGLRSERDQLRSAVEILSRTDTRTVEFGKAESAPHGRVLVNRNGGLVFAGSKLPALTREQTFELWLIPATGAPKPAGLFRPNESGEGVNVSSEPVDARTTKAVAVSIEPRQGSSAPTTKPILIVPLA